MKNELILIKNNLGLEVYLSPVGAGIYAIKLDGKYMTLTPKNIENYDRGYYGKTIAPVPNRLEKGRININGKEYIVDVNEGENSLHSGLKGICYKPFNYSKTENEDSVEVVFTTETEPTEGTVPGHISYKVTYKLLLNKNELMIYFEGNANEDTYISMTNHAYFSMGESTLENLSLRIPSKAFIETRNTDLIPLRETEMLDCLNFTTAKPILKDIDNPYLKNHRSFGIDHAYKLAENNISLIGTNYQLDIDTDFEYLQIYSDNYEDGVEMFDTNDVHYRGVAIEPEDSILDRNITPAFNKYSRYIRYTFIKK